MDIAEALEQKIISDRIMPGVRMPSAAELAKQYSVSPKTADRALSRLAKRKLIVRKRGVGNFVLDHHYPESRIRVGLLWWTLDESVDQLSFDPSDIFINTLKKLMDEHLINYELFIENSSQLAQPQNREKKYDLFLMPAGVILNDKEVYRSAIRVPMIIYGDCKYNSGPWHQVFYDFKPGFAEVMKYCRRMKKHKFFLPFKDVEIVRNKCDALFACAGEVGFGNADFHICHIPENITDNVAGGEYCAGYFLKNQLQDHLILSVSDFFTYGMQKVFNRMNLKYSVDYSLISYDNFRKYIDGKKEFFNVSSVTHPLEDHARALVDMIEEVGKMPQTGYYRAYVTAAKEFVIR